MPLIVIVARSKQKRMFFIEIYFVLQKQARNPNFVRLVPTATTTIGDLPPYFPPNGVVVTVTGASISSFQAQASHPLGTRTYTWDSANGGLQG